MAAKNSWITCHQVIWNLKSTLYSLHHLESLTCCRVVTFTSIEIHWTESLTCSKIVNITNIVIHCLESLTCSRIATIKKIEIHFVESLTYCGIVTVTNVQIHRFELHRILVCIYICRQTYGKRTVRFWNVFSDKIWKVMSPWGVLVFHIFHLNSKKLGV